MSDHAPKRFSTGAFARLCGTTKDTLFHYDRLGLLKPETVGENGYRRYACGQLFAFDLIRVLRQTGCSLEEIKGYLEQYDVPHFLALCRKKQAELAAQRQRLEQMERMLQNTVEMTEWALSVPYDAPYLERQEAETLLLVRLNPGDGDTADGAAARLAEHFARCERYHLTNKFPLGSVILREQVLAGQEEERYFFSVVDDDFPQERLLRKPAGRYATIVHRGDYDSFSAAYRTLLDYLDAQGLRVCGNAYVYDLVSYLASQSQEKYVLQISIQVEDDSGA